MSERTEPTNEKRTAEFFANNYDDLATMLEGRDIVDPQTGKRMRIASVQGWSSDAVGPRYKHIASLEAGDLWAIRIPVRRMKQSLIVASDRGIIGACVRIIRGASYNQEKNSYENMPREGDIANFFELDDDEVAKLKILDDTGDLYLQRSNQPDVSKQNISTEEANSELTKGIVEGLG